MLLTAGGLAGRCLRCFRTPSSHCDILSPKPGVADFLRVRTTSRPSRPLAATCTLFLAELQPSPVRLALALLPCDRARSHTRKSGSWTATVRKTRTHCLGINLSICLGRMTCRYSNRSSLSSRVSCVSTLHRYGILIGLHRSEYTILLISYHHYEHMCDTAKYSCSSIEEAHARPLWCTVQGHPQLMCPAMQASGITSPGEPCVNPRSSILILRLMLMAHSQANVDIPIRELLEGSRRFGRHVSRLSFGVSSPLMTGSCLDWCDGDIGERADGAREGCQAGERSDWYKKGRYEDIKIKSKSQKSLAGGQNASRIS